MKIIIIIGNRPQFVKAAALWRALDESNKKSFKIIHTGQHYDENMSDIFFKEMGLPNPNYFLGIGGCEQGAMTGRILEEVEKILLKEKPDYVIVFGDTNSTLAGALAAVKLHIPIAHIEAGLRCFNKKVPEEINRVLTDHCSNLLFTPTDQATSQLLNEGLSKDKIHQVGDIMLDCFLHYGKVAEEQSEILTKLSLKPKKFILTTVHRADNADDPTKLEEITRQLCEIADDMPVIFPVHPRTKKTLETHQLYQKISQKLTLCDPLGYLDMVQLEKNAQVIITDSGGVQKEAFFCGVPCLILRKETEWTELVEHAFSELVDIKQIKTGYEKALSKKLDWNKQLYGDGTTSQKILHTLMS